MRSRIKLCFCSLAVLLLTIVVSQIFSGEAQAYQLDPPEISVYARNESDAKSHVDMMCNSGYPVGHGGYVHDIRLNEDTGVLTWSVTTISRRCDSTDATATTAYAVTGYDGICPTAGWYHNGSQDTHDCIKYQDPATMTGVSKCGGPYPINNCSQYGNWWSIVKGTGTQPSTNYTYRTYRDGFTAQIPNWETAKHADGEYTFINNQTLCGWWTIDGVRYESQSCQTIWAKIKWHAEWYLSGESLSGICLVSRTLVKMGECPAATVTHAIVSRGQLRVLGRVQRCTGITGCAMTALTAFLRHLTCRLILIQSVAPLVEMARVVSK